MAPPEEEEAGIPEWVVTFGDMMSLLLTFFILLYSMSEVKKEESTAMIESMRKQFGHERSMASLVPGRVKPANAASQKIASMGRARRQNTMNGGDKVKAPVGENPRVTVIQEGPDTSVGNLIYFVEGSDEMLDGEERKIEEIVREIRDKPQSIRVAGHTTARPLGDESPYLVHDDLAYARAIQIKHILINSGIKKDRINLDVVGAGEPLHIDHEPEKLKLNARVQVSLIAGDYKTRRGTSKERSNRYEGDSP